MIAPQSKARANLAYREYVEAASDTLATMNLMRWIADRQGGLGKFLMARAMYKMAAEKEKNAFTVWMAYGSLR